MNTNPRFGETLPLELLKAHPTPYFAETGTSNCAGVETARHIDYERIYTIDVDRLCWFDAVGRYHDVSRITPLCGDSSLWLRALVSILDKPTTFWLDAHDDGGPCGLKRCPILEELAVIGTSHVSGHVLLIDDRRCFGLPEGWSPDITEYQVREAILQINPTYQISVVDSLQFREDIIVATLPK